MTTTEKILARASEQEAVRSGDLVICRRDMVTQIDMPLTRDGLRCRPKKLFDADRVALVIALVIALSLVSYIPALAMWLPNALMPVK